MSEDFSASIQFPKDPLGRFKFAVRLIEWADEIGPLMRDELKKQAPVRKDSFVTGGRLRQSIRYRRTFTGVGGAVQWTANTPYAEYVVHGTRDHDINAKATRALRFMDKGGGVAFRRHVHVKGAKPNDFPKRASEAALPRIYESFRRHVTEGI